MDIELDEDACYDNYGTATLQYFNRIYEYFFHNHLIDLNIYGSGSVLSDMSPVIRNYQTLVGGLVGIGSDKKLAYFNTNSNVQEYEISGSLPSGTDVSNIEIIEVFYMNPYRQMTMYPGLGGEEGIKAAIGVFGNNPAFFPNTELMSIHPSSEIYRWRQSFQTFMNLIQSDYRYEILDGGKKIRLIPAPSSNITKVYFEYIDLSKASFKKEYIISPGMIPEVQLKYDNLNTFAKGFIIDMAYGYNLISIGEVRSKYDTVPVPDSNVSLNGPDIISRGQDIVNETKERLDKVLEELRFDKLIEERASLIENINELVSKPDCVVG